jgi:hypothetical protein
MSSVATSDPESPRDPHPHVVIDPVRHANSGQPGIPKARLAASVGE